MCIISVSDSLVKATRSEPLPRENKKLELGPCRRFTSSNRDLSREASTFVASVDSAGSLASVSVQVIESAATIPTDADFNRAPRFVPFIRCSSVPFKLSFQKVYYGNT